MSYDPLKRGPHPVGVRTEVWNDDATGESYTVEIYYPATAEFAGADLDPEREDAFENQWDPGVILKQAAVREADALEGEFPFVLNMHGWSGFRVEFTYINTHLASHGYLVVSPDMPGSTAGDVAEFFADPSIQNNPQAFHDHAGDLRARRIPAVPYLVQTALDRLPVKDELIGFTGPSLGGWTAMIAPRLDPRIKVTIAQCPAGGTSYVPGTAIDLGGPIDHGVPTLMLVGSRDSMLPLYGQFEMYHDLVPGKRRMIMLLGGDHNHFGDSIEAGHEWMRGFLNNIAETWPTTDWDIVARLARPFSELAPAAPSNDLWLMAILSQFDAVLKNDADAQAFIDSDFNDTLESRTGLNVVTVND